MFRVISCVVLVLTVAFTESSADKEALATCRGDPNAVIGCKPDYCGQICFQDNLSLNLCRQDCSVQGCHCIQGFKLDPNQLKCVPESQCSRPLAVSIDDGALN